MISKYVFDSTLVFKGKNKMKTNTTSIIRIIIIGCLTPYSVYILWVGREIRKKRWQNDKCTIMI